MTSPPRLDRVSAPRLPAAAAPFRFPLFATVAPVVVSVGLFAFTGSPFMLLFAALGPLTAAAGFADSRFGARRGAKRERERFVAEAEAAAQTVRERHRAELAELRERSPGAPAIVARRGADPDRWRATASGPVAVVLGSGSIPSSLEVERPAAEGDVPPDLAEAIERLEALAATLHDAPVVADASLGIGVAGARRLAIALARALVVQAAWGLSPQRVTTSWSAPADEEWLGTLPHRPEAAAGRHEFAVTFTGDDGALTIAAAADVASLPAVCRIVVRLGADGEAEIVQHPDRAQRRRLHPAFLSREQAFAWALRARRDAVAEGHVADESALPADVRLCALEPAGAHGLAARFAVGAGGAVEVDLVRDGPHAVVGGTTGSGKSELLVSWVVAMAAVHPPERVTFLLVDFKGGAAFAPLRDLPHTVGIVTDLDEAGARRALASLRAELHHRERELARAGAGDIAHVPGLPRLVIVVDEFAAMMAADPELHALFADLAARGRSLGVHLVLCTQRPAGVVRDAVLANAELRISLRVNNRADSEAVVGSSAAADLPVLPRGRAIVRLAGVDAQPAQVALATSADVAAAASRWAASPTPRRPWCEPLPPLVQLAELGECAGVPLGLLDLPHEQRQGAVGYVPERDGHVLVLGGAGTGKTGALLALAAHPGALWLPSRAAAAWDVLDDLVDRLDGGRAVGDTVLLADDLDALLGRFGDEHRAAVSERLGRVLREGPGVGIRVVIAAQRVTPELQPLTALVSSRLLLRMPSREEFLLAGGAREAWQPAAPPGRGLWVGHPVQVVRVDARRPGDPPAREGSLSADRALVVVTTRAGAIAARLRAAGHAPVLLAAQDPAIAPRELVERERGRIAIVGDVEDWQGRWGALPALRPVADILFDACSTAELRSLTRSRELAPPLEPEQLWWWREQGDLGRARLP